MPDSYLGTPCPTEFLLYQTADGRPRIEVRMVGETVWLGLQQMADLFGRDRPMIPRRPRGVFIAERQALRRKAIQMNGWISKLDDFVRRADRVILTHAGRIGNEAALKKAHIEFEKFKQAQLAGESSLEKHLVEPSGTLKKLEKAGKAKNGGRDDS